MVDILIGTGHEDNIAFIFSTKGSPRIGFLCFIILAVVKQLYSVYLFNRILLARISSWTYIMVVTE